MKRDVSELHFDSDESASFSDSGELKDSSNESPKMEFIVQKTVKEKRH